MKEDYEFGHLYEEKIKPEDANYFAKLFGEGSIALTELLQYCIVNEISTIACCKGHPEEKNLLEKPFETGYIAFKINDDYDFAYFLASLPLEIPGVKALVDYNTSSNYRAVSLEVPALKPRMSEDYFRKILEKIREYNKAKKNGEEIVFDEEIKKVVDYEFTMPSTIRFYVTNKEFQKLDNSRGYLETKVTKCPRGEYNTVIHSLLCGILDKPKKLNELLNSSFIGR